LRISYYTHPWAFDVPGGGERQLLAYQAHLPRFGLEVQRYDMWNPLLGAGGIFHCFSCMPGVVEQCDYAKRRGCKLVVSPNLWVTRETKDQYPFGVIWNVLELADAVVVNSVMEMKTLSDVFGMAEEKFHVVYNAAEADFLLQEDASVFTEAFGIDGPYVLNVANIEPRKNQARFIEALRCVRPDLTIVIAGYVRDEAYADECRRAGGERLKIIGALPYASRMLRAALSGCEFFAMPSLLETPSIAAIEAAAIGSKVLLTNRGSTTEYFGDSVTYVSPESEDSLRVGINAVLSANSEVSTWVAHDRFMWPKVIPKLVNVYRSLA